MKELLFEQAIRLLVRYFDDTKKTIKPTLLHSIRVGLYLDNMKYSQDVCLGGFLHDILEDTLVTEKELSIHFGVHVCSLIKANTKNSELSKESRNEELIQRCSNTSQDALIIKTADVLDNFQYYCGIQDQKGIDRCISLAHLVLLNKKPDYNDPIFSELKNTVILKNNNY